MKIVKDILVSPNCTQTQNVTIDHVYDTVLAA